MNPTRDRRAIELLDAVLELPEAEVAPFLDEVCGDDSELRSRIESLMGAMGRSGFLSVAPIPEHATPGGASTTTTTTARRLQPGTVVCGRYTVVKSIGAGGMGEVYRATDTRLGREVALKTLNVASLDSPEMQDRFDREIRSVAALMDRNIVTLFDVVSEENVQFAVMELVVGETLRELISRGVDRTESIRVARGVAMGLCAAHSLELMHRDIKPDNIIVDTDGVPKILDFGLARQQQPDPDQRLTVSSVTPGTIPYMSPEQAEGRPLTCATDIFSLGTVLYEMLTGTNPFRADSALQTMRRVSEAKPPEMSRFVHEIPPSLEACVRSMLSQAPDTRPTAREVVEQCESLIDTSLGQRPTRQQPVDARAEASTVTASEGARAKSTHIDNAGAGTSTQTAPRRRKRWQPSLVILPFQVFASQTELEPLADGLVENLTTVLTRVPLLSLTSRMSSFSLKGQNPTAEDVRRRFSVDYMVEGSLQPIEGGIRANVQLVETEQGFHLWAQQFDVPGGADAIAQLLQMILPRLEPQLIRAVSKDLRDNEGDASSRELLLQAIGLLTLKGWHRDSFAQASRLLRQSIEIEPDLALTHAHLALTQGLGKRVGLVDDEEAATQEAIEHAEKAMDLDNMDSNVLGIAGCAISDIGQTNRAIPILQQAIDLNPNNAQAYAALGSAYLIKQDFPSARASLQAGIDLSPADARMALWNSFLALAYIQVNESETALRTAEMACRSDRKTYIPRVVLTAVHLMRDEPDQAFAAIGEALRIKPDLSRDEITHLVGRKMGLAIRKLRRQHGDPPSDR